MKSFIPEFFNTERNNFYAETPPKIKASNGKLQRRPPVPIRTDSSRSSGSITISPLSSQSTTPSNSFRLMSRSADATSSCGLITQMKHGINNIKSKSTHDFEPSILKNNNKLESVKEDECLVIDKNKKVNRFSFKP
jgi:hypothetical protein